MAHITLEIKDNSQIPFFMQLVKNLKFVKKIEVDESASTKEEILAGLKDAVNDVNLAIAGKKKLKSVQQLLNEL